MTPRRYDLGRRQEGADATRGRIVEAARALIAKEGAGVRPFSMEAVAREAGVARTTVYHQFGTRAALLEALFDSIAERGEIARRFGAAFRQTDVRALVGGFVAALGFFWDVERVVIRRIQAMAVLDVELERGLRARHERRRYGVRTVVERVRRAGGAGGVTGDDADEAVIDVVYALTSFEMFGLLAGERRMVDVVPVVQELVWRTLAREKTVDS